MVKPIFVGAAPWAAPSSARQDYGLFRNTDDGESRQQSRLPEGVEGVYAIACI